MNREVFLRFSMILVGVFLLVTGVGVWVTNEPLMSLCRQHCWVNALLYGIFGEFYGKVIYGGKGVLGGSVVLAVALHRIYKGDKLN